MPLWYILSLKGSVFNNSIEATNYFFETGLFQEVDPAFMFNFQTSCTNDPMFGQLWGLRNTTNAGIDINICNAWTITRGAGVSVAVIDQGIDPNHDDLRGNFHSLSFNAQIGQSPSAFVSSQNHGTHVAGTIGAVKNNRLQVVGVAPESRIMRVSHTLSLRPNVSAELASGISWAWQNGADVINNSWGDQGGQHHNILRSAALENAIIAALANGRNGRGAVVVFASGNFGVIDYPANFHPDILVVGSINNFGRRAPSSGHGSQLDVVAPGVNILSTNNSNGTITMSGTSMAAPHVAGIAALILSIRPDLTQAQVRHAIESTARNLSAHPPTHHNGQWNNQVGFGLVDAYAAVRLVAPRITSSAIIGQTSCEATYRLINHPPGTITWSWSPQILQATSPNGTSQITLGRVPTSANVLAPIFTYITATFTYNGITVPIRQRVQIRPDVANGGIGSLFEHSCHCRVHRHEVGYCYYLQARPPMGNFPSQYRWTVTHIVPQFPAMMTFSGWNTERSPFGFPHTGQYRVELRVTDACGESLVDRFYVQVEPRTSIWPGNCGGNAGPGPGCTFCGGMGCPQCMIFRAYPNPVDNILTIDLTQVPEAWTDVRASTSASASEVFYIRLFNAHGVIVRQQRTSAATVQFDVSNLPEGTYYLHIEHDGEIEKHQIIVQRN